MRPTVSVLLKYPVKLSPEILNWLPNLTITLLGSTRREQAQNEKHSHKLEIPGFDPRTSRMLSELSTTVPHSLTKHVNLILNMVLLHIFNYPSKYTKLLYSIKRENISGNIFRGTARAYSNLYSM